ncbi:MAG: hypothetical protein VKJ46_14680 [Leptolyngbyaceae bacterium]|nr:hypothetical protein [Leptolyngbyaceae bacterium]
MKDVVLTAPDQERHTYFFAFYGTGFQKQTGLLHVEHDFSVSVKELHILIRERINEVLGEDTPSCFQIFALAAPQPLPCLA